MNRSRLLAASAGLAALTLTVVPSRADDKGEWVTIKGQVVFTGKHEPKVIDVQGGDKPHCTKDGPLLSTEFVVNPKSKGVKNVVVWLRPDTDKREDTFPKDKIHPKLVKVDPIAHVVDQPCCQFVPRILAARAGDTLEIKNSAPVAHNVNYSGHAPDEFNVTLPANGGSKKLAAPLAASKTPILLKCDIHPWMQGRVRVFDHPYFATTDDDGKFEIKDVPAGKWRVVYWHEGGFHKGIPGALGVPADVTGGTTELKPIDLELPKK